MINQEILDRYNQILISNSNETAVYKIEPIFGDETNVKHLLWMLQEIETNKDQSLTKKHRWLGFIQGIVIAKGWATVSEERDATRSLFNGD